MKRSIPRPDPERILADDGALQNFLAQLLERATHRQFWTMFFDEAGHLIEPIMPMDDHPLEPSELCETDDLGTIPFAAVILTRTGWVCEAVGADSVLFVWERPGPPRLNSLDLRWVEAITAEAERQGVRLRTQFLLHSGGLCRIKVDQ